MDTHSINDLSKEAHPCTAQKCGIVIYSIMGRDQKSYKQLKQIDMNCAKFHFYNPQEK